MRLERREAKRRIEQRRLGAAGRRIADGRPTITDLQRMSAQEYALTMDRIDRREAERRRTPSKGLRRFRWFNRRRSRDPRRTGIPKHPNCRCSL